MKLVLLRGVLREHRHWGALPDLLQARYPDCEVICPDLAGNGARYLEESPASIEDMVEDLRKQVVSDEDLPEPLVLIAISMGGMIATQWAMDYPDEVLGMVLINTSFSCFSRLQQRFNPEYRLPTMRLLFSHHTMRQREQWVLSLTSNLRANDALLLKCWTRYAQEYPQSSFNMLRQLWAAARYSGETQAPLDNVLLLCSEGDRLVHPDCTKAIAKAWKCPLVSHHTAGHDLSLDAPEWLLEQLEPVLRTAEQTKLDLYPSSLFA